MKCKICGSEMTDVVNCLYFCDKKEDDWAQSHVYTASCKSSGLITTEEFRVIDIPADKGYVVWIDYDSKETHLKIMQGHKFLKFKVLKDTVLNLDLTTEKSIIDRINKLMVLF